MCNRELRHAGPCEMALCSQWCGPGAFCNLQLGTESLGERCGSWAFYNSQLGTGSSGERCVSWGFCWLSQTEHHPHLIQRELIHFCKEKGIFYQAYSSLGTTTQDNQVCQSFCLNVCLWVCPSFCLFVCLPVCLFDCL